MIRVSDGSSLTVVAYIAAGGQGEVYRVLRQPDNTEMALKWYTNDTILRNTQFRQTLQYNCNHNAPSQSFLWPLAITETINGSYGYVMKLRPEGFIDLGKFFCIDENPQAYFRSTLAKLTASLQICDAFSRLHQSGFSYQDINDGSFLIDPLKGHVRICDNDNIVFDGLSNGIAGKTNAWFRQGCSISFRQKAVMQDARCDEINRPFDEPEKNTDDSKVRRHDPAASAYFGDHLDILRGVLIKS